MVGESKHPLTLRSEAYRSGFAGRLEAGVPLSLALLVALAALVRFATLSTQSFDYDELQTAWLVDRGVGEMLGHIPRTESTPPLFYLFAWGWSRVFGIGEVGLRSLSAALGTLTVPVVFVAGRRLLSARVGLIAAALAAVSPWLVFFSQEARAYALATLLVAIAFAAFVHGLEGSSRRARAVWTVAAAMAIATHYFTAFAIAPMAAWLIAGGRSGRRAALAWVAAVGLAGMALLPLALEQRAGGMADKMIAKSGSLGVRSIQLVKQSLIGYDAPYEVVATLLSAGLCLAIFVVFLAGRPSRRARRAVALAGSVGAVGALTPVVLALVGPDYVVARNVIAAWVPLLLVLAVAAACARRAGAIGAAALAVAMLAITLAVNGDRRLQREDWRGAANALGQASHTRAIVLYPDSPPQPFSIYLPGLDRMPAGGASVGEVDLVLVAQVERPGVPRRVPVTTPATLLGLRLVEHRIGDTFVVARYAGDRPLRVTLEMLRDRGLQDGRRNAVLIQPAASP